MSVSEYFNVFKARMTADGDNYKKQIENIAQRNFDRYIIESPTSVDILYEGEQYKVAIVENKQDESRLSKQMFSSLRNYFPIGSLIYWKYFEPIDCPENFWIVWKIQQNSLQDHTVSYISRCNHKLKWIDTHGIRHEQYVYEFSSRENMIRATFKSRVQEIIASEPNKFMEIIMPFTKDIKREQRFIIDGEGWYVIEFDSSSVEGITYITLGEDKKDLQQDLLIENGDSEDLANYKDENKFYIDLVEVNPIIGIGENYTIRPYYYESGNHINNSEFNFYINDSLVGNGTEYTQTFTEDTSINIKLAKNENIQKTINIMVRDTEASNITYYIVGDDTIKWGRTSSYFVERKINNTVERVTDFICYFSDINAQEYATYEQLNDTIYIKANNKRKIGTIQLVVQIDDIFIEKNIAITSLW